VSVLVSVADSLTPKLLLHPQFGLEARVGIEPTNAAFAEPCLTTWLPRHPNQTFTLPVAWPNFKFCCAGFLEIIFHAIFVKVYAASSIQISNPNSFRRCQSSCGLNIPNGVMIPVIKSAGVTSKPGLRAPLDGFAIRM